MALAGALGNPMKTKTRKRFNVHDARSALRQLRRKLPAKATLRDLMRGMNVELEHRNVTHGDPLLTAKIALAHLRERADYYDLLSKAERAPRTRNPARASRAKKPQNTTTAAVGFRWDRAAAARLDEFMSRLDGVREAFAAAPMIRVPPDMELWATQERLGVDTLAFFVAGGKVPPGARDFAEPQLISFDGALFVWNGHHRLAAAKHRGDVISARWLDAFDLV